MVRIKQKQQTADCRPSVKWRLRVHCKMQTEASRHFTCRTVYFVMLPLLSVDHKQDRLGYWQSQCKSTGLSLRAVTCNTCYGWVHSMLRVKMSIDGTNMLHLPNLFLNIKHIRFLVSCLIGSTIFILLWRWIFSLLNRRELHLDGILSSKTYYTIRCSCILRNSADRCRVLSRLIDRVEKRTHVKTAWYQQIFF